MRVAFGPVTKVVDGGRAYWRQVLIGEVPIGHLVKQPPPKLCEDRNYQIVPGGTWWQRTLGGRGKAPVWYGWREAARAIQSQIESINA